MSRQSSHRIETAREQPIGKVDLDTYLIDEDFDDFLDRDLSRTATSLTSATSRTEAAMAHERFSAEHHAVARHLAGGGLRVTIVYAKGGFRVRNPDMTKPPFVDHSSFISFRKALVLFTYDRRFP